MGSCCGTSDNGNIEDGINKDKAADREIKKLLLLGAGSSGKSTFFKQLKVIHGNGFTNKDRRDYAAQIENQIISQMQKLIIRGRELIEDYGQDKYGNLEIKSSEGLDSASYIELLGTSIDFNKEVANHIKTLWNDPGIQNTWTLRGLISVPDSCAFFFDNIDRICNDQFIPSDEDILLVRKRTTGIIEEHFIIKGTKFHIFDVGGQRNERKKWIHSFENVTAVIYVAALSHFDAVCFEDESQNAMHESISLFNEICNSKWFRKTAMILFLNKSDLFREKLMECLNIDKCFNNQQQKGGINSINGNGWDGEEYHGPCYKESDKLNNSNINQDQQYFEHCYKSQVDFIAKLYYDQRQNEDKKIFTHITNATDRTNVEKVFWDCQNIVIRKNLSTGGFT